MNATRFQLGERGLSMLFPTVIAFSYGAGSHSPASLALLLALLPVLFVATLAGLLAAVPTTRKGVERGQD